MSIENIFPNKQQFDTINERLLEIANNVAGGSSKLTKPTNPSAESAVTMLADGTVGTKPLSEIGGKIYLHKLELSVPNTDKLKNIKATLYVYSSTLISFVEKIPKKTIYGTASISCRRLGDVNNRDYYGTAIISTPNGSFKRNIIDHFYGPVVLLGALDNSTYVLSVNNVFRDITFTDEVIEL